MSRSELVNMYWSTVDVGTFCCVAGAVPPPTKVGLPLLVMVPLVMAPSLFPQLVSAAAEMVTALPVVCTSPSTVSAAGGLSHLTCASEAWTRRRAFFSAAAAEYVGYQPTASTIFSLGAAPLVMVRKNPPADPMATKALPSYGAAPVFTVALPSAQIACSTPDSASVRACAARL